MKIAKLPNGEPEIFLSIQGEGPTIGKPVVFVRAFLCNLRCKFCDTSYTWDSQEFIEMTEEEVADYIRKVNKGNKSVVFTGGEPFIQQVKVAEVARQLGPDWYIEVETNGTFKISPELIGRVNQINCSPKLKSSGNEEITNNKIAEQYNGVHLKRTKVCFKFVICADSIKEDIDEVNDWVTDNDIDKELVYLMPEGIERYEIIEATKNLIPVCQVIGYNLSPRLHIMLFGNKRAV